MCIRDRLIIAGPQKSTNTSLSLLRNEIGARLELIDTDEVAFAFVTEFPLFEWDEDGSRWEPMHHAFTMPKNLDSVDLEVNPDQIIAQCYDVVANGDELASGSIRICDPELQRRVFRLAGYSDDQIDERFGHMLTAFKYGAPPHGGIAPGIAPGGLVRCGWDRSGRWCSGRRTSPKPPSPPGLVGSP